MERFGYRSTTRSSVSPSPSPFARACGTPGNRAVQIRRPVRLKPAHRPRLAQLLGLKLPAERLDAIARRFGAAAVRDYAAGLDSVPA